MVLLVYTLPRSVINPSRDSKRCSNLDLIQKLYIAHPPDPLPALCRIVPPAPL
jgi:hypothetical protein